MRRDYFKGHRCGKKCLLMSDIAATSGVGKAMATATNIHWLADVQEARRQADAGDKLVLVDLFNPH